MKGTERNWYLCFYDEFSLTTIECCPN